MSNDHDSKIIVTDGAGYHRGFSADAWAELENGSIEIYRDGDCVATFASGWITVYRAGAKRNVSTDET